MTNNFFLKLNAEMINNRSLKFNDKKLTYLNPLIIITILFIVIGLLMFIT